MADQPSIFESNTPTPAPVVVQPAANVQVPDPLADLLASVKNERGEPKYKDVTEALNGLKHAQEYIPSLKSELSAKDQALVALQAENERLKVVEQSILALNSQPNTPVAAPAAQGFDESKIADMVARTIAQRENESVQKTNLNTVVTSIQQSFGADAEKVFYDKAKEFGMSNQEMNALASKSPKAVLTMFGLKAEPHNLNVAPINGSVNTQAYQPKQDTFVGRNTKSAMIGATTEDLHAEAANSRKMVEELHNAGLTVHDLSDPKIYKKYFK